ncbi:MAG: YihY/virulence factor BrkB family protein [Dehalococcoidia bacterium]
MRFLLTLARRSVQEFFDDNCTQMAAAISYYVLFSLFPLLIFLVAVLGLVLRDSDLQREVIDAVVEFIPLSEMEGKDEVTNAVEAITGVASGALTVFGLVGLAWSGSNMFSVIRRSLNTAYDLEYKRPFVQAKLLDLAMVIGVGFFFMTSIGATAFLRSVRQFSEDIPALGDAAETAGFVWVAASFAVPFLLSFVAFSVLYWIVPATRVRLRDVWPGALVAAVLFEVGKTGFAFYLENFSNYDLVYGSLGAVVAFLTWTYISAMILLFGAEVASEYPRVRAGLYEEERAPKERLSWRQRVRAAVRGLFVGPEEGPSDGDARARRR